MDDVKKAYREVEQDTRKNLRDADGNEDLADKIGNVGDEARKDLGNTGDDLRRTEDETRRRNEVNDRPVS